MTSDINRLSDEDLRRMLAECEGKYILECEPGTMNSLLTELLALRAAAHPFANFYEQGNKVRGAFSQSFCDIETGTSASLSRKHFSQLARILGPNSDV
jgi:hypothetical protein